MSRRVRLARLLVSVEAVVDDGGENVTPIAAGPIAVNADDWSRFALDDVRQELQQQIDAQALAPRDDGQLG